LINSVSKLPHMKRKPGFFILLCLTIFLAIGVPACGPDYYAIRDIAKIEIFDPMSGIILGNPATTTSDSISLVIYMEFDGFSYYHIQTSGMMNEAWATSPEPPIMANEIKDIRIFCDQPIYGFASGQDIKEKLQFGYDNTVNFSLNDYLEILPNKGDFGSGFGPIYVNFNTKPAPGDYTFTVEMEDNNGHVFTSTASTLQWL